MENDLDTLLKFNGIIIRNFPGKKAKDWDGKGSSYKLGMIIAVCKLNV